MEVDVVLFIILLLFITNKRHPVTGFRNVNNRVKARISSLKTSHSTPTTSHYHVRASTHQTVMNFHLPNFIKWLVLVCRVVEILDKVLHSMSIDNTDETSSNKVLLLHHLPVFIITIILKSSADVSFNIKKKINNIDLHNHNIKWLKRHRATHHL